ncbi:hypothetical protein SAMN05421687_105233 [Salimicrobium flavidum]|uniref:Uncharacterized protein n=1 Tax=Salimicrobium flavidum TaxID=570947 RepID=A0A1N7JG24_9BACI|nr:hypothetical protein SAMN05421687_105233 [Salimicrobium flavidum]
MPRSGSRRGRTGRDRSGLSEKYLVCWSEKKPIAEGLPVRVLHGMRHGVSYIMLTRYAHRAACCANASDSLWNAYDMRHEIRTLGHMPCEYPGFFKRYARDAIYHVHEKRYEMQNDSRTPLILHGMRRLSDKAWGGNDYSRTTSHF